MDVQFFCMPFYISRQTIRELITWFSLSFMRPSSLVLSMFLCMGFVIIWNSIGVSKAISLIDDHKNLNLACKVEKILKGSLDSIPSPLPSVKIQIMGGKVCLRCKSKTLLGIVNKLFIFKSLLTTFSNVLPLQLSRP